VDFPIVYAFLVGMFGWGSVGVGNEDYMGTSIYLLRQRDEVREVEAGTTGFDPALVQRLQQAAWEGSAGDQKQAERRLRKLYSPREACLQRLAVQQSQIQEAVEFLPPQGAAGSPPTLHWLLFQSALSTDAMVLMDRFHGCLTVRFDLEDCREDLRSYEKDTLKGAFERSVGVVFYDTGWDPAQRQAMVQQAHEAGYRVVAHCFSQDAIPREWLRGRTVHAFPFAELDACRFDEMLSWNKPMREKVEFAMASRAAA
jgi:hypothetical protein